MNSNSTLKPARLPVQLPTGGWKLPTLNDTLPAEPSQQGTPRIRGLQRSTAGFIARPPKAQVLKSKATHTESESEAWLPQHTPRAHPDPKYIPRSFSGSESETESEDLHVSGEPGSQAVPEAAAALQTTGISLPGTFGILSKELHDTQREKFQNYKAAAEEWEKEKKGKRAYARIGQKYEKADGTDGIDWVWVRSEEKLSVQIHGWQVAKGKELQTGLNKVGRVLREKTGRPRKTGGNYGSDKGKGLLNLTNQSLVDFSLAAVSGGRLLNQGPTIYANADDPSLAADLTPVTDGLAALAVFPSGVDAALAAEAHLRQVSEREKAKNDLRFRHAAERFVSDPENATPEDAEGFLKFMEACEKLFDTTLEDSSTRKAARNRAIRAPLTLGPNTIGAVIEGVNSTVSVTPLANLATLPLVVVAGAVEAEEGKHELLRRVDQRARATSRKNLMQNLMQEISGTTDPADPADTKYLAHEDNALAISLIECFTGQQDRLLRQAKREMKFAWGRIFKGGGTAAGAAAGAAALAALAGVGLLTAATAGAAAGPLFAAGAGWTAFVAARNYKRVRAERNAKWRQRMVQAIALDTPREKLESKLAGNENIEFAQEEGEYEPDKEHFAGLRTLKLKARDNEYLGLHLLALKIQDMARDEKPYDKNSPVMKVLHANGIDELRLMGICKAAAAKKPSEQLDYIQSRLAPKLGMKFILAPGTQIQKPPHESIFLEHFREAAAPSFPEIRKKLEARYPDPSQGMLAFRQGIKTFLQRTQHHPETDDTKMLKEFDKYLTAGEKFNGLVRKKKLTDARIEEIEKEIEEKRQMERTVVEATALVQKLEQFHFMRQADQIELPRA